MSAGMVSPGDGAANDTGDGAADGAEDGTADGAENGMENAEDEAAADCHIAPAAPGVPLGIGLLPEADAPPGIGPLPDTDAFPDAN